MAFVADTKILTSKGWKYIKDISGRDRVLVRNFIGDAEFIQPFALKRSQYEGDVYNIGAKDWSVTLTPDHKIVYNANPKKLGQKPAQITAKDVVPNDNQLLFRRFRYLQENRSTELIKLTRSTQRTVTISMEEWFTILAFTVLFSYIDKRKHPRIVYIAEAEKLRMLTDILDRIGVEWAWNTKTKGNPQISLRNDSNIVLKLVRQLGSRERRDMRLMDKTVYGASRALLRHFVDKVIELDTTLIKDRSGQFLFSTVNRKFMNNIEMMCLLGGYGFSLSENSRGLRCRIIPRPSSSWHVRKVEKETYRGYIYEIDLFDGLVYVTEGSMPVWMAPK